MFKPAPSANCFFEQLTYLTTDVEERRAGSNGYYVAVHNGVECVVCHDQREQQKKLDQMVEITKQRKEGYVCRMQLRRRGLPLYYKSFAEAAELKKKHDKTYPIHIEVIIPDTEESLRFRIDQHHFAGGQSYGDNLFIAAVCKVYGEQHEDKLKACLAEHRNDIINYTRQAAAFKDFLAAL